MNGLPRYLVLCICAFFLSHKSAAYSADKVIDFSREAVTIEADSLLYDHKMDAAEAKGNVSVTQDSQMILSDELIYFKKEGKIYAKGNVAILRDDGNVYFADIVNLDRFLYKGRVLSFQARLKNNGLIAANSAEMYDKNTIQLNSMVFSTCKVCASNLIPFIPLWQIRAKSATLNQAKEKVAYKHARIEVLGAPILYTPYISTPTPGAAKKSGLLRPSFKWSNALGSQVKVPFYINIAPNMDATIAPIFSSKVGNVYTGEFRHLIPSGSYTVKGSITKTDKVNDNGTEISGKKEYRGHIKVSGDFKVDYDYLTGYVGGVVEKILDNSRTYLKKYNFGDENVLTTHLYHKNFWNHSYVTTDVLDFQGLRPFDNLKTTPKILPLLRIHHEKLLDFKNTRLIVDTSFLNLVRSQGANYRRGSVSGELEVPFLLPYGQLLTVSGKVRADGYQVEQRPIIINRGKDMRPNAKEGTIGKIYPQAHLKWSLPLYNHKYNTDIILEPVASFTLSPDTHIPDIVPNEDSQALEVSAVNLFNDNRYLGMDRIETGNRASLGLRGNISNSYVHNTGFILGQAYRFSGHEKFRKGSGLDRKSSDYVTKFYIQPSQYIFLIHRMRLNKDNFSLMRNEINGVISTQKGGMSLGYMSVSKEIMESHSNQYRKEVNAKAWYNIYDKWWANAKIRTKLGQKDFYKKIRMISDGVGLTYKGDCLNVVFEINRDYTKLKDVKPNTTYTLKIEIPTF